MHSLHKSQYCSTCESYFTGGTLAGQHFCGKVELNDKKKSSPLYTKVLTEKKAKFICRYCSKSFVRQAYYEEHELKHRVVTHHRCDCCGLYFPNAHKCQSHKHKATCTPLILDPFLQTADHSESIPEKSDIPDVVETVGSNVELRNCFVKLMDVCKTSRSHEQIHCEVCGKTFRLRVQEIYKEEFKCGLCQEAFIDSKALSEHCLTHMPGPSASKCQFCKRHFSSRTGLIRHIRLHTGEKPFPCLTCGRHFHRKEVLKLHQEKCTAEQPPPLQTSNAKQLQAEHGVDTSSKKTNKAYNCSYCPHSFRFPNNLKLHERAHLAKTVFPCSKCGKFYRKRKFKDHVDHEKQCQGKSSSFLQRHLSLHSKETAFCDGVCKEHRLESLRGSEKIKSMFCKFCTKSFLRARYLRRHILTHTEVKPYRCKTCESCFSRYDHLKLIALDALNYLDN
uniref:Zinc finger protein Xfin-like n=1 Tax=Sinocyclocheilus rhinocerous TaxID=307959 RepID=A0A673J7H1_9TELE